MTDLAHPRPRLAAPSHLLTADPLAAHADCIPPDEDPDGYISDSQTPGALPHLPATSLHDPELREHFIERLYAQARLRELFAGDWRPGDLVAFHSRHKLQILAHDPAAYRHMGRMVAQAGTRPATALETEYRRAFTEAFAVSPTPGRHTNALGHVLGPLSNRLDPPERHEIVAAIASYHQGEAPLRTPIALLRHYAEAKNHTYLADQTYLAPYPPAL
ncbi:YbgA family protein, partial [Actinomadura welshii]